VTAKAAELQKALIDGLAGPAKKIADEINSWSLTTTTLRDDLEKRAGQLLDAAGNEAVAQEQAARGRQILGAASRAVMASAGAAKAALDTAQEELKKASAEGVGAVDAAKKELERNNPVVVALAQLGQAASGDIRTLASRLEATQANLEHAEVETRAISQSAVDAVAAAVEAGRGKLTDGKDRAKAAALDMARGIATEANRRIGEATARVQNRLESALSAAVPALPIKIATDFVNGAKNPQLVFAEVVSKIPTSFDVSRTASMLAPDLNIGALSARAGVLGATVKDFFDKEKAEIDPSRFFPDAKLLGAISLRDILAPMNLEEGLPGLRREGDSVIYEWAAESEEVQRAKDTRSKKAPKTAVLKKAGLFDDLHTATLNTELRVTKGADGKPSYKNTTTLSNFALTFFNVLTVSFKRVHCTFGSGQPLQIMPEIEGVGFSGQLNFFNSLQKYLTIGGAENGPFLEISPRGAKAGIRLSVPDVTVGAFSLMNLRIEARLMLSFTGDPLALHFRISDRANPFLVSVGLFAGAGYFSITLTTDPANAVLELEGVLEFGAHAALAIGPAHGEALAMGGVFLRRGPQGSVVEGYFRVCGQLDVLGLISISARFYVGLRYEGGVLTGNVEYRVEIQVGFFKQGVTIGFSKRFSGSPHTDTTSFGRPAGGMLLGFGGGFAHGGRTSEAAGRTPFEAATRTPFSKAVTLDDWQRYAAAFAPIPSELTA
jgi:hypothetical protein